MLKALVSDQLLALVTTTFSNSRGGRLRELRLYVHHSVRVADLSSIGRRNAVKSLETGKCALGSNFIFADFGHFEGSSNRFA